MENENPVSILEQEDTLDEEGPPVLKSWKNLYVLVLANLCFWILMFTLFTFMFK